LIFLTINGHHHMLSSVIKSYELLPVGAVTLKEPLFNNVIHLFNKTFIIAFKMSLPVIGVILLTDIALSLISRTMPQMNIFIVGIPIKVTIGIFVIAFCLPMYLVILDIMFNGIYNDVYSFLKVMSP
ncbi:MAG TPA: flagellar type III secretion system protein FliR, partial [Thermoanaerobacterales bacterium]|nr:flagellar type III secretion system protein FliR [Thermoanaerobacterales bacterium]